MWLEDLLQASPNTDGVTTASVLIGDHRVPVALSRRDSSDSLCVLYNGAVDRSRSSDGVVFQRSSWASDISANALFVADGAILSRARGQLGWGQFSEDDWVGDMLPPIVRAVRRALRVAPERTLHFGSSAGGFQALAVAGADPGSSALVNNPQTDWLRYEPASAVDAVLRDCFSGASRQDVLHRYPWRARVWEWFAKLGHFPKVHYVVNTASDDDIRTQLAPLQRALIQLANQNPSSKWSVDYYYDAIAGHSPLARTPALKSINSALRFGK